MEIRIRSDYRLQFQKTLMWTGRRWRWKITGWIWVSVKDPAQPPPPKAPPAKFYLLGFRKSNRTRKGITRKKIIGAYYSCWQEGKIMVVYCECVP